MLKSIALTIVGLIFTIAVAIIYFKKKKYKDLKNSIYRFILVYTIFLGIMEICCVYTMSIRNEIPVFNEILCRAYLLAIITWFSAIVCYIISQLNENITTAKQILSNKLLIGYIFLFTVLFIISCFLDIEYTIDGIANYYVISGNVTKILYVGFALVGAFLAKIIIVDLKDLETIQKIPVITLVTLYAFLGALQLIYYDLNEVIFLFSFCVVAIYFTFESQDMHLVLELEAAKQEAELADKSKTQFLTKMSHEIRTPMNVIMGYSEVLLAKKSLKEKDAKEDVRNIYNAGKSLLEIINNILMYSRIESGKEKVEDNEYTISDIIGELESFVYAKIDPKKVNFSILIDGDIPSTYIGDKLKVYRILVNLINNAIKYTESGEITLTIRCKELTENIVELKFEVKDTGEGIKKEELENIFNELNKVNEKDSDVSGIGLGLILTKKIINMLDGKIQCESEFGIGTTFSVGINQKALSGTKIKDVTHLKDKIKTRDDFYFDCSKYKIMIVDDNKLNRMVIERQLKSYKAKYDSIDSSTECINKIKSGEKYDLILLDHMMPELDGIETLRILKAMKKKDLPPVIAVTANIVTELKETYINEGFSDFLSKPVEIKDLNYILRKYLKKENKR